MKRRSGEKVLKDTRNVQVRDFMSKPVQTIPSGSNVARAIKKMAEKNVGSLVVSIGGEARGILSERDLVSKLVALGKEPDTTKVSEVVTGRIVRFNPRESLLEAARAMNSKSNRILIYERDEMTGILTATDIVRALHELGTPFPIEHGVSNKIYSLKEGDTLEKAVEVMSELWVGSVIVLDSENDPAGIFTERDLVKKVLAPGLDLKTPVGKVASRPLITADEDVQGNEAADVMAINHIKRLPLTRDGSVVGIVTARDLVEAYGNS